MSHSLYLTINVAVSSEFHINYDTHTFDSIKTIAFQTTKMYFRKEIIYYA